MLLRTVNIFKNGDSKTSLGNLFQCLTSFVIKNVLPYSYMGFPVLEFMPLLLSLDTTEFGSVFFTPSLQVFMDTGKFSVKLWANQK